MVASCTLILLIGKGRQATGFGRTAIASIYDYARNLAKRDTDVITASLVQALWPINLS